MDDRFRGNQGYDLKLVIKDIDYTSYLESCRIVTSLNIPYVYINIFMKVDTTDLLLDKIYGQDKIKLFIRLLEKDGNIKEEIKFELMTFKSSHHNSLSTMAANASTNSGVYQNRLPFTIPSVPRDEFKGMTEFVNELYFNKSLKNIIEDLVGRYTKLKLEIDEEGLNDEIIDQIIIPPMTLYKAIQYLDGTFGIYNGPVGIYAHDGILHIKNLSKNINKLPSLILYRLVTDWSEDELKEVLDKCTGSDQFFYTFNPIKYNYNANSKYAILSRNMKFIVKPRDTLFHVIEEDLHNICKDNGLTTGKDDPYIDTDPNSRTKYYHEHIGYEKTESFMRSQISKSISNLAVANVVLEKDLYINNFFNIGDSVKINTKVIEEIDIAGIYILKSSLITLGRIQHNWSNTTELELIRTSKTT